MALEVVPGWGSGVGAAGGGGPAHDAGLWLAEPPAGRLLAPMVPAADRSQAALTGEPGRVGDAVVQVAEAGLGAAAGRRAADGAGADQVLQHPAGGVPVFLVPVVAAALGDRVQGDVQSVQQVVELRRLGGVRPGCRVVFAWSEGRLVFAWLGCRLLAAWPGARGVVPGAGGAVAGGAGAVAFTAGP